MLLNEQTNNKVNIIDLLFWTFLAVAFPLCSGMLHIADVLKVFVYFGATLFVGDFFINKISIISNFPGVIKTGLSIVFGSIICGLLYLFIASDIVIYLLFVLFIAVKLKNKQFNFQLNSIFDLLCLAPLFLMLFQTQELAYATHLKFNRTDGDYFYYTAIVESLKTNHSFSNAVYHQGIGINYQALALLPAAHIAKFVQLPSQIALWGVYFKILPIVSFGVIATCIVQLYNNFFKPAFSQKQTYFIQFFVVCMLMFFGPLHIVNLLKRDFANTLFLGEGYVLPLGSPGFAMSMLFSGLCLYLILSISKPNWYTKIIFISFLCIIIASKLALFFPLAILLGFYALLLVFKKEYNWLITLLIALPVCLFIFKFALANSDNMTTMALSKKGYYFDYLPTLAAKYHITGSIVKQTFLMFFISVFMWLNVKFIILFSGINHFRKTNQKLVFLVVAALASFCIASLPSFCLDVYAKDANGIFLFDARFDMPQFIRADIFLITIISIFFILYFALNYKKKIIRYVTITASILWIFIIAVSFLKSSYKQDASAQNNSWYSEAINDYNKAKPGLMAMIGNNEYSGQTLCGAGVHPWFCTGLRKDEDGYTMTLSAHNRNVLFQEIFDTTKTLSQKKATVNYLKKEGVTCVVASPFSIEKINTVVKDSLLTRIEGTKWFYKIN